MRHFRRWSIRLKLTLMLLVPLLLLLALSNGAFIYAEFSSFEERTRSKLAPLAVVLGTQATAALSFNEPKSTESDLASLSAESGIVAAFVFDAEGDIFAGYPAPLLPTGVMLRRMEYGKKLLSNESDGGLLMRYGDEAHFVQPILLHDEHLGTIQLVLNLQELHADFYDQLRLRGAIILIALLLAVLFSVSLPRLISEPIRQLRRLMTEVCRQQDYRRLGHKVANDEIGDLVDGFNEVLREVETRDQALLEHSLKLEQQVAERTMELTQAKEAAEDADRAKGEFLANMNHEIRTPLNTVLGYVSLLEEKELDAEGRDYLRTIQTAGTSLLQLVQDILDLSRLESGRDQLQPGPVELKRLMVDTKRMLVHRTEKKGVEFVVEYADELPRIVLLDETRILQILINLASNAAKFTDQGQIRIEATGHALGPTEWRLELNVEDTGIGIPKGQHEEVFKAFTQSRGQRLAEYGGTGLGLAICSRLAESMGGEIRLRSSEGAGSCFSLILPSVQVAEGQSPGTEPLQGREFLAARVLVADDNPSNLQLLVQLLVNMGFEVQQAVAASHGERSEGW
ncbi:MAG: ATP-binding protein [Candidatus Sedimenticola sp. (ex Thyasira tokunagai)]